MDVGVAKAISPSMATPKPTWIGDGTLAEFDCTCVTSMWSVMID